MPLNKIEVPDFDAWKLEDAWEHVIANANNLLPPTEPSIIAGGNLGTRFGLPDSEIWQGIVAVAQGGQVEIAGLAYQLDELQALGELARKMKASKCTDERLADKTCVHGSGVHEHCGMCEATKNAIGIDVSERLMNETGQQQLQSIYDMPHASAALYVAFGEMGSSPTEEYRVDQLAPNGALPFRGSMPVETIESLSGQTGVDLLDVAARFTPGTVAQIMMGHNAYQEDADKRILVADTRGADPDLIERAISAVEKWYQPAKTFRVE